ncbi:MAG TPA: 1,4-dihydroxy-2-naphthoate polyprenyltransferase [Anaerolineaceae bacterium]
MESLPNIQPSRLQRWLMASRPRTLPAAISPVLAGSGIAIGMGKFDLFPALIALFCALMIQIGANMVNDVMDYLNGTDTVGRLGPTRVTQTGLLTPREVFGGILFVFGLAALAGIYMVYLRGWIILAIGAACILAATIYTAGPFPLTKIGLGDLFVLIFFGFFALVGTVFAITGSVPLVAWSSALGVGALATNILVVNNIRDTESDRRAGRRSIPVVFGRHIAELEFSILMLIAYLVPVFQVITQQASLWALLPILSLPPAIKNFHSLRRQPAGRGMNLILAKTAQVELVYSLLLAVGLALT